MAEVEAPVNGRLQELLDFIKAADDDALAEFIFMTAEEQKVIGTALNQARVEFTRRLRDDDATERLLAEWRVYLDAPKNVYQWNPLMLKKLLEEGLVTEDELAQLAFTMEKIEWHYNTRGLLALRKRGKRATEIIEAAHTVAPDGNWLLKVTER